MYRHLLIVAITLLAACASHTGLNSVMPTYQYNAEAIQKHPIKKVVIASANVSGEPTRYYLQNAAARVDEMVKSYLQNHGYTVAPNYVFENAWTQAIRTYGDMYDPTTGKVDPTTYRAVMFSAFKTLRETSDIDAVIFTDVVEVSVSHSVGLDHLAQWDGVSRKPKTISAGTTSITQDFNWNQTIRAATLAVTVYTNNLEGVFSSRGGLDVLEGIDTKGGDTTFSRRKKPLDTEDAIEEGIELAFHPFIKMKGYPEKK
ncbi:MAG: hypothetical protein QM709_09740 [Spongiibacteraceae bacterium]